MKTKTMKKSAKPAAGKLRLSSVRKKLLAMRDDLVKTVRKQKVPEIALQDSGDSVDQASQSIEKELLFELSDNERVTLDQVEAALRKLDKGNYGLCEACRNPIAKPRLDALPFARYCISCQSSMESAPETAESAPDFRNLADEPGGREG
ncbi:MAG: TraR/DksA family transcriptional regulator [Elusimicrobia bacterium]|nr:TraR/DksA family transcriptional regulator [Elusimicrobiota bacterium]